MGYIITHWQYIVIGYFLTDKNKLCEGDTVETLEACKGAVDMIKLNIPKAHFYKTESNGYYPKGCYLYVGDDVGSVFFNEHETGSSHNYARQICGHGE